MILKESALDFLEPPINEEQSFLAVLAEHNSIKLANVLSYICSESAQPESRNKPSKSNANDHPTVSSNGFFFFYCIKLEKS